MTDKTPKRGDPPSSEQRLSGHESISRRAWPKQRQWRVAAFAALVVVGAIAITWFGGALLRSKPQSGAEGTESPPGTFRATEQQLKTLTIEPVASQAFVSEELTEGKIAVNGDRTTPLYSPYSGRVVRVIAGLGDRVPQGAALATVSDYHQPQFDCRSVCTSERKSAD